MEKGRSLRQLIEAHDEVFTLENFTGFRIYEGKIQRRLEKEHKREVSNVIRPTRGPFVVRSEEQIKNYDGLKKSKTVLQRLTQIIMKNMDDIDSELKRLNEKEEFYVNRSARIRIHRTKKEDHRIEAFIRKNFSDTITNHVPRKVITEPMSFSNLGKALIKKIQLKNKLQHLVAESKLKNMKISPAQ